MHSHEEGHLVDWAAFAEARSALGADFVRILGYFREDGTKSVAAIEEAMRNKSAAAMVLPAHTLKGESRQFGAEPLAEVAEKIEIFARRCVEIQESPDEILREVVKLRPMFEATLGMFEREVNPLVERRRGFGQRPMVGNQGFGRL